MLLGEGTEVNRRKASMRKAHHFQDTGTHLQQVS
jgi:hypothetical protein